MEKAVLGYKELAKKRGLTIEFSFREIQRNNLINIIDVLTDIAEKNENCTFDLAGGEDLYLVAAGAVFGKYPHKIQLHRFNIYGNMLSDCDCDGNVITAKKINISVEENILIYGGKVIFEDEKQNATYKWKWDAEFTKDVLNMWNICKENAGKWNKQTNTLEGYNQTEIAKQSLEITLDRTKDKVLIDNKEQKAVYFVGMFHSLAEKRLIKDLKISNDIISFRYKNSQIKKCLTTAGQVLELYVTHIASTAKDSNGTHTYNDILTGAVLDWDGVLNEPNVENEIDVMLMKGLIPIFISCKNGGFEIDELYKLNTVAERFGGEYAKKVLIASDINKVKNSKYILARAEEMGIRIIGDISKRSAGKINKAIRSLGN